jgi:adenylate cyclase
MDRIWQWAWDRCRARYSWAIYVGSVCELLSVYLVLSFLIVAFERSDRYVEAAAATVGTVLVMVYVTNLPGLGASRLVERWAAGHEVDRVRALDAIYAWTRTLGLER